MANHELFEGSVSSVRVAFTLPDDLGTSEAPKVCRGSDGCFYVVKDKSMHSAIPHSEWFCSGLGEEVGIPAPVRKIMDFGSANYAFGSRWQGPQLTPTEATQWTDQVAAGEIAWADTSRALSRIYAFDQFVHNHDRHAGNVLVLPQYVGHAIFAFDYSQAWTTWGFPLASPPLPPQCNTVVVQRALSDKWGASYVDCDAVEEVCNAISCIPVSVIEKIISSHPQDWLSSKQKGDIISWWGSDDMNLRLSLIVEGVRNGKCL